MPLSDDLLLEHLRGLRSSVDKLQVGQDELHATVGQIQQDMVTFKDETKKEARKWGAVGGAFTTAAAIVVSVVKSAVKAG
jgi:hypothetical protein